jgi:hypothetical protein
MNHLIQSGDIVTYLHPVSNNVVTDEVISVKRETIILENISITYSDILDLQQIG